MEKFNAQEIVLYKSLYLDDYNINIANRILQNKRNIIISSIEQFDYFIDEALDTNVNKSLHLGMINKETIMFIKEKIKYLPIDKKDYLENNEYDLVINQSEIRHLKDNKKRLLREDIHEYVKKLPNIISNFDSVVYGKQKDEGLRFKKKISNYNYYSFCLVSNKKHTISAKTIYIEKLNYEIKKRSISLSSNNKIPRQYTQSE